MDSAHLRRNGRSDVAGAAERAKHWSELSERGADWGPALVAFVYRNLGRTAALIMLTPVITYFYLAGARQRRASLDYLKRVWKANGRTEIPGHWQALCHFFAFGEGLVDKFAAWIGHVQRADLEAIDGAQFEAMRRDPRGAMMISAHVGNSDIVRAIASHQQKRRINVVLHTKNARRYNDIIQRFAPKSQVALIEASEFGPATAMELAAAVERGEWIVIMADRHPIGSTGRTIEVDFLGAEASLPQGPFLLAAALKCPVYMLFCVKRQGRYRVHFSTLAESIILPRKDRTAALRPVVERYVRVLEDLVKAAPYQWFNFYDYWARPERAGGDRGDGKA